MQVLPFKLSSRLLLRQPLRKCKFSWRLLSQLLQNYRTKCFRSRLLLRQLLHNYNRKKYCILNPAGAWKYCIKRVHLQQTCSIFIFFILVVELESSCDHVHVSTRSSSKGDEKLNLNVSTYSEDCNLQSISIMFMGYLHFLNRFIFYFQ